MRLDLSVLLERVKLPFEVREGVVGGKETISGVDRELVSLTITLLLLSALRRSQRPLSTPVSIVSNSRRPKKTELPTRSPLYLIG